MLINEQSLTECELALLQRGENLQRRPPKKEIEREKRIKSLVCGFKGQNWKSLLDGIASNMGSI